MLSTAFKLSPHLSVVISQTNSEKHLHHNFPFPKVLAVGRDLFHLTSAVGKQSNAKHFLISELGEEKVELHSVAISQVCTALRGVCPLVLQV